MTDFMSTIVRAQRDSAAFESLRNFPLVLAKDGIVESNGHLVAVANPFAVTVTGPFRVEVIDDLDGLEDPTTAQALVILDDEVTEEKTEELFRLLVVKRLVVDKLRRFGLQSRRWYKELQKSKTLVAKVADVIISGDAEKYEELQSQYHSLMLIPRPGTNEFLAGICNVKLSHELVEVSLLKTGDHAVDQYLPVLSVSEAGTDKCRVSVALSDDLGMAYLDAATTKERAQVREKASRTLIIGQMLARSLEVALKGAQALAILRG